MALSSALLATQGFGGSGLLIALQGFGDAEEITSAPHKATSSAYIEDQNEQIIQIVMALVTSGVLECH